MLALLGAIPAGAPPAVPGVHGTPPAGVGLVSAVRQGGSFSRTGKPETSLIYRAETLDGRVVASRRAARSINGASLIKIATSLWAVEKLGPDHRFTTRFEAAGRLLPGRHLLDGDLLVKGGGDPDFHVENGFMVALALEKQGIRRVTGRLLVTPSFWMGWENGVSVRRGQVESRGQKMAARLRFSLDKDLWDQATRDAWTRFALDHGLEGTPGPRLQVEGKIGLLHSHETGCLLVRHQSRRLKEILRRFNTWSNNDIQGLEVSLGGADGLARFLSRRWGLESAFHLGSLSGLGENRISLEQLLRLLRDFRQTMARHGLDVQDLLPTAGCGGGTLARFPRLDSGPAATSVVGKTGTLTSKDGGITLLAGYGRTASGELLFCVAWPGSGRRTRRARRAEEDWVLSLLERAGGPVGRSCPPPPGRSDQGAFIMVEEGRTLPDANTGTRLPADEGVGTSGNGAPFCPGRVPSDGY
ncbi:MAG: D-alanyl-D-alanine carboxypeptidase [Acidobacteriota bacterium]